MSTTVTQGKLRSETTHTVATVTATWIIMTRYHNNNYMDGIIMMLEIVHFTSTNHAMYIYICTIVNLN